MNDIKKEFPLLNRPENVNLAYLDNAAMTQKPGVVLDAMNEYYTKYCANAHRGIYPMAERVTEEYEGARGKVASFIGAKASNVIFTRNTTEGLNMIARGLELRDNPIVVLTEVEHHSNVVPWQKMVEAGGGSIRYIPATQEGELDLSDIDTLLKGADVLSMVWVSNVVGIINPVKKIIERAKAHGVLVVIDAAQAVPHFRINVDSLGADVIVFSSYKLGGPTGVGVVWANDKVLSTLTPLLYGGHMVSEVEYGSATFKDAPWKFEAGTQDIAGVIGLGAAIDFLTAQNWDAYEKHEKELSTYLRDQLTQVEGVHIFGSRSPEHTIALVSFNIEGVHSHDAATLLGEEGVCVRAGHHCVQPFHKKHGLVGSIRASAWWYNSKEDIDRLIQGIHTIQKIFS